MRDEFENILFLASLFRKSISVYLTGWRWCLHKFSGMNSFSICLFLDVKFWSSGLSSCSHSHRPVYQLCPVLGAVPILGNVCSTSMPASFTPKSVTCLKFLLALGLFLWWELLCFLASLLLWACFTSLIGVVTISAVNNNFSLSPQTSGGIVFGFTQFNRLSWQYLSQHIHE